MSLEHLRPDDVITPDVVEARLATAQARRGAEDLWEGLARLVKCRGWLALGYPTFRAWAVAELNLSGSNAHAYLKKTTILLEMAQATGMSPGQLEHKVPVRAMKHSYTSPVTRTLRTAANRLAVTPILANPDEHAAAIAVRGHLNRLLGD